MVQPAVWAYISKKYKMNFLKQRIAVVFHISLFLLLTACNNTGSAKKTQKSSEDTTAKTTQVKIDTPKPVILDTNRYKAAVMRLCHDSASAKWPVKKDVFPLGGALLPFNRIVAYYGNFYSKRMGILGELPPDEMLKKLMGEVKKWKEADSTTPVIPAIHYICVTAQGQPGKAGKYILRMPFKEIDKAIELAKQINAVVFLDVQTGQSTLKEEIPLLEQYLKMPNVHMAIDPEFSMKTGKKPGSIIGTFDAEDINYVSEYLAKLVRDYKLPPKILCVHRFTFGMVTNYEKIKLRPEVQTVMDMDGWGFPAKKVTTYRQTVFGDPVQFTGFKLFYKNDILTAPWNKAPMTPQEVLKLYPKPIYIQYQ